MLADSSKPVNKQPLAEFKVGVDNVIFSVDTAQNRLLVLLVMREREPFRHQWNLPRTLVRQGESLEDAAYRILADKIRVQNLYLEQLYSFGNPGRDPRESVEGVRYLSVSHFALVRLDLAELTPRWPGKIAWYPIDQVPQLAFDHNKILEYGYRRLRAKLEYSPVAGRCVAGSFYSQRPLPTIYHGFRRKFLGLFQFPLPLDQIWFLMRYWP